MGSKGAVYIITADVGCKPVGNTQIKKLRATITFVDIMGIIAVGHGPSSFSPGFLTPEQAAEIKDNCGNSVREYLEKTNTPMTNQGSYYYSVPMLKVKSFKIAGEDGNVLSEGSQGTLWMDYVVQSFKKKNWHSTEGASWHWFAIQFPDDSKALVFTSITYPTPSGTGKMTYAFAMLYNSPTSPASQKLFNGSLLPEIEWKMNGITISPDPKSAWKSPHSDIKYYTK